MLKLRGRPERDYISIADSAVIAEQSQWDKYMTSGFDPKHVALVPSVVPTVFKLRALTRAQAVALNLTSTNAPRTAAIEDEIVAVGLRGVTGVPGLEFTLVGSGDKERVDEKTLNLLLENIDLRHELATMVVKLSSLVPLDD